MASEFIPYTQGGTQVMERIVEVLAPRPILHVPKKWEITENKVKPKPDVTSIEVNALMRKFSRRIPKV